MHRSWDLTAKRNTEQRGRKFAAPGLIVFLDTSLSLVVEFNSGIFAFICYRLSHRLSEIHLSPVHATPQWGRKKVGGPPFTKNLMWKLFIGKIGGNNLWPPKMFTEDIYNLTIPRWSQNATTSLTCDMSKTNAAVAIPDGIVISKIFTVRGKKVMVDTDLAELYGVTTKRLNEQVAKCHASLKTSCSN